LIAAFLNRALYSGNAGIGWNIPGCGEIKEITDFAMITDKAFHNDAVFKFLDIEH